MDKVAVLKAGESSRKQDSNNSSLAGAEDDVSEDGHKQHRCRLSQPLQRDNVYRLAKCLHTKIWLRFKLREDEHMFEMVTRRHERESHTPVSQVFHYHYVDQDGCLGNSESVFPAGSTGLMDEAEQANTAVLQHDSSRVRLIDSLLFSPWFVLSATFTGCPQLLQNLLSASKTRFLPGSRTGNVKPDVSRTNVQGLVQANVKPDVSGTNVQGHIQANVKPDVSGTNVQGLIQANVKPDVSGTNVQGLVQANVKPDVSGTNVQGQVQANVKPDVSGTNVQGLVQANVKPDVSGTNVQGLVQANVKPDVSGTNVQGLTGVGHSLKGTKADKGPVEVPTGLRDKFLQPCLLGPCQLVNRRTACEFPICDTWINESELLLLSPLHLACWRHDFTSIVMLLQHGADPNALALEHVPESLRNELMHADSADSTQDSFVKLCYTLWFYNDRGLSPLHFIALGVRSKPRHSIVQGCEVGIIHDSCGLFQQFNKLYPSASDNILACSVDYSKLACVAQTHDWFMNVQTATECQQIVNCLDVLLRAGAKPNMGQSLTFKGAYALDIVLQPPSKVYYAADVARYSQTSESQRLYDLQHNASQVVAACQLLLRHDARLSPTFLATYTWRPELLDCFHLDSTDHGWQLVHLLIRLGVFNDRCLYNHGCGPDAGLSSISVFTSAGIHRFIADVMNTSIPASLTSLIFKWGSVNMLHDFVRTISMVAEMSSWNDKLRELSDTATSLQMRSLKHSCFYVILSRVRFRFSAIWSLPLPVPLKRALTELDV